MFYVPFNELFPDSEEHPTRVLTLDGRFSPIPAGEYALFELFCDQTDCDCRRVMLNVVSLENQELVAVISYGWENAAFYEKWLGMKDKNMVKELQGYSLNTGSPQSKFAPALLDLMKKLVFNDKAYIERLKEHYKLAREQSRKLTLVK